ncbi:MAG: SIMPL domain-containing protein [Chloracidobacterium sp.]|nr:SIMPL domain-containing protein [Chloracidobacterium sp.]
MKLLFAVLFCGLIVTTTFSQTVRSSVSVVGEAKMSISPDQVVFTFEVVTADKDLAVPKRTNDTRSAKTLTAAKVFQIGAQDIQTDSLTISPQYTGSKDLAGRSIGYEAIKRIFITLKELDKIDTFFLKLSRLG